MAKAPSYYDLDAFGKGAYNTDSARMGYEDAMAGYGGAPTIYQSMNKYLNPYTKNVIDDSVGRLRDSRSQAMDEIAANASAAGAFGGSRHGLVESQTYSDYNRNENEMINNLLNQRFNTAAGLGAQDVGSELTARGINQGGLLAGAGGLKNLGDTQFGQGQSYMQTQGQLGSMTQQLQQKLLDIANQDVSTQQNWPFQMMQFLQQTTAGNPLAAERYTSGESTGKSTSDTSGTTTTTSSPSMMDIIGDAFSMASGIQIPGMGGGGSAGGGFSGGGGYAMPQVQVPQLTQAAAYTPYQAPQYTPYVNPYQQGY